MLTPDKTRIENGVTVNEKIIPKSARANKYCASWCKKGEPMKPCLPLSYGVTGVTIHNTDDLPNVYDDAEQYTRATWPNCNMGGVVVHYYVDEVCAWQNLEETEAGWHASDGLGQGNYGTIAIEVIMSGSSGADNEKAEANAVKLAASIMHRHGLTIEKLYKHQDWCGKYCPAYIMPHWSNFKSAVKAELDRLNGANPPKAESPEFSVGDIVSFTGTKHYTSATAVAGANCKPGKAKVTRIVSIAKHPYHLIAEKGGTSTVYGWVDAADVSDPEVEIGCKVKIKPGAVYGGLTSTRGRTVPVWITGKVIYTVSAIETHNGVKEALMKEIKSWVAVGMLERV